MRSFSPVPSFAVHRETHQLLLPFCFLFLSLFLFFHRFFFLFYFIFFILYYRAFFSFAHRIVVFILPPREWRRGGRPTGHKSQAEKKSHATLYVMHIIACCWFLQCLYIDLKIILIVFACVEDLKCPAKM